MAISRCKATIRFRRHRPDNTTAQGAPGTSSNIPTYQQAGTQGGGQTQKTDKTTDYDVNTQTEHQVVAPGQLKQLSLSVIVDGQLDPAQQKQIEDMVASAAGIYSSERR